MGQLNKPYQELEEGLKEIGKENLEACYTPKELLDSIWYNVLE